MMENDGIAYYAPKPTNAPDSFVATPLPTPEMGPGDLIVHPTAIALNPVDSKIRATSTAGDTPHVGGFDAVGVVVARGADVTQFTVGDRVAYAGSRQRPGSQQRYQAVDARLVAPVPANLTDADAAGFPLVSITAWELLFDKMGFIPKANANAGQSLLVINGAGGVGSVLCQLARWSGLEVVATASPRNFDWLRRLGVHDLIDYHKDIPAQLAATGHAQFNGIAILHQPTPYMALEGALVTPFGHVGTIVLPAAPLDVAALKDKAASLDFEFMFARSNHNLAPEHQGNILTQVLQLHAADILQSITTTTLSPINVANVVKGTLAVESGHQVGKVVLTTGEN